MSSTITLYGHSDDCAGLSVCPEGGQVEHPFGEYTDKRVRLITEAGTEIVATLSYEDGGWGVTLEVPGSIRYVPEERGWTATSEWTGPDGV